jgi:hypothetical protein
LDTQNREEKQLEWCDRKGRDERLNAVERQTYLDELLRSPIGVLVVARSIVEVGDSPSDMPFAHFLGAVSSGDDMACCLQELATREGGDPYFDLLTAERLSELIVQCGQDLSPYTNDYQERADILLAHGSSLRRKAAHLLDAPATADWFADLDRKRQVWIARDGRPAEPASFSPDLRPFGAGSTKPRGTFWTSTSVGKCPSGWIAYLRWGEDGREPPYHPWRLQIPSCARVYEVHGPQAWHTLCLAYPAPSSLAYPRPTPKDLIEPDWQAVAHDWDGIHLSVGGLLTAERVRWGQPGAQTLLFGWSVESTAWLQWVFDRVERLPDVDWHDR